MNLLTKSFSALTTQELFLIAKGRVDVFVVEQACAYPELDEIDCEQTTEHMYWLTDNLLVAYARCYVKNNTYSAIGRVLINKGYRGNGLAQELVASAVAKCFELWPNREIYIGAQTYLLDFYRSLGFEEVAQPYLEDGIEHQDMILKRPIS